jgi:hydrogenase nickel incorporation protein HypA/HybF
MHEMSLAIELVRELDALAAGHGLSRITAVEVTAGQLRGIVPTAMEVAFASAAEGSAAENASLSLTIVPARARCRTCGREFVPDVDAYVCPACQVADAELLAGNDILITSIEADQPGGTDTDED